MATNTRSYDWGNLAQDSGFRSRRDWTLKWWIMFALIVSFGFHGVLIWCFENMKFASPLEPLVLDRAIPERLKIDPELLKQQDAIRDIPTDIAPVEKPNVEAFKPDLDAFDKAAMIPENQEIDLTPSVKDIQNLVRATSPNETKGNARSEASNLASLMASAPLTAGPSETDIASAMAAVKSSILAKPTSKKQMVLDASPLGKGDQKIGMELLESLGDSKGKSAANVRVKGFSSLDELISGGGKVGGSTDPILMPTDLLFEFGSDELAEGARVSLMKLGFLISKNPNSVFIIEGHTDTIGDDGSNMALSERRAQAVVSWLQRLPMMRDGRVQAVGFGESSPMPGVSTTGTKEQQSMNRRVEIKVRPRQ